MTLWSALTPTALASDELTTEEKIGTAVMLASLYVDYRQTMDIKNHPNIYEKNPILGDHPSDVRIRNYFALAAIGSVAVVYILPPKYRMYFIGGVTTIELITINNNRGIGLRTNF